MFMLIVHNNIESNSIYYKYIKYKMTKAHHILIRQQFMQLK